MPPTTAISGILRSTIRQVGICSTSSSCLLQRTRLSTNVPSLTMPRQAPQWRAWSTAATVERDVEISGGPKFTQLCDRSVLRVTGSDAADLIQGLVANDVNILNKEKVMYTMFLSSAGRVLYDVMVYRYHKAGTEPDDQCFLIECDKSVTTDLLRHMVVYRVRKKADVNWVGDKYQVWVLFDPDCTEDTPLITGSDTGKNVLLRVNDPRIRGFGQRVLTETTVESLTDVVPDYKQCHNDLYTVHRYRWGVPEGVIDLPTAEALPLESNLAYMNGVSFDKGCYLGQELTARTHYTGVIRKRIMPIEITGGDGLLTPGSVITTPEGKNAGRARGHLGQYGLGLMRVNVCQTADHLKATLKTGHYVNLKCHTPDWWVGKHD